MQGAYNIALGSLLNETQTSLSQAACPYSGEDAYIVKWPLDHLAPLENLNFCMHGVRGKFLLHWIYLMLV